MNVYDFDKTIYAGDATVDFYLFCLKRQIGLIRFLPIQILGAMLYYARLINKERYKEFFFSFLKGIAKTEESVDIFWECNRSKLAPWYLQQKQDSDVIISASPDFLLKPLLSSIEVNRLIATQVDSKTGKFFSLNCYGLEKPKRFLELYPNLKINNFYSDSLSDAPMADLADSAWLVQKQRIKPWPDVDRTSEGKLLRSFYSLEFLLFLFVGSINVVNGVLFAWVFSLIMQPNLAFISGYIASLAISYLLNSLLVFRHGLSLVKYLKFCISYIPNFLIQNLFVLIFYNLLQFDKLITFILAAILAVPITFLMLRFFTFQEQKNA